MPANHLKTGGKDDRCHDMPRISTQILWYLGDHGPTLPPLEWSQSCSWFVPANGSSHMFKKSVFPNPELHNHFPSWSGTKLGSIPHFKAIHVLGSIHLGCIYLYIYIVIIYIYICSTLIWASQNICINIAVNLLGPAAPDYRLSILHDHAALQDFQPGAHLKQRLVGANCQNVCGIQRGISIIIYDI